MCLLQLLSITSDFIHSGIWNRISSKVGVCLPCPIPSISNHTISLPTEKIPVIYCLKKGHLQSKNKSTTHLLACYLFLCIDPVPLPSPRSFALLLHPCLSSRTDLLVMTFASVWLCLTCSTLPCLPGFRPSPVSSLQTASSLFPFTVSTVSSESALCSRDSARDITAFHHEIVKIWISV